MKLALIALFAGLTFAQTVPPGPGGSTGSGGGGSSVSLTGGTGISVSPNPITGTGVITNTQPGALPAGSADACQTFATSSTFGGNTAACKLDLINLQLKIGGGSPLAGNILSGVYVGPDESTLPAFLQSYTRQSVVQITSLPSFGMSTPSGGAFQALGIEAVAEIGVWSATQGAPLSGFHYGIEADAYAGADDQAVNGLYGGAHAKGFAAGILNSIHAANCQLGGGSTPVCTGVLIDDITSGTVKNAIQAGSGTIVHSPSAIASAATAAAKSFSGDPYVDLLAGDGDTTFGDHFMLGAQDSGPTLYMGTANGTWGSETDTGNGATIAFFSGVWYYMGAYHQGVVMRYRVLDQTASGSAAVTLDIPGASFMLNGLTCAPAMGTGVVTCM